jgi:hypothetical protein
MITIPKVINGAASVRCSGGVSDKLNEGNDDYSMWNKFNFTKFLFTQINSSQ